MTGPENTELNVPRASHCLPSHRFLQLVRVLFVFLSLNIQPLHTHPLAVPFSREDRKEKGHVKAPVHRSLANSVEFLLFSQRANALHIIPSLSEGEQFDSRSEFGSQQPFEWYHPKTSGPNMLRFPQVK